MGHKTKGLKGSLMSSYPDLKGFLFIVTYGRSGSTLLMNLLSTLPGSVIRGENYNTMGQLFEAVRTVRRTKAKWADAGRDPSHPWYGAPDMHPERFADEMNATFVKHVLNPPKNARWIGFKEIRYVAMGEQWTGILDFMRNKFPNSHIVMNTRDQEKVLNSAWWKRHDPAKVRQMVTRMDADFANYNAKFPDCTSLVRFEDYSSDPLALKPVFDALGEPMNTEAMRKVIEKKLTH